MSRRAPGPSRTSHKPKRDSQRAREAADLKRENHQLKRQVARLRKQLDQADEPVEERALERELDSEPCCPSCQSHDLMHVEIPGGRVISGCRSCEWRSE